MSFNFQGYQLTPGMHDERFTDEATLLWGRWDQVERFQVVIDESAVDAGNTNNTTQLRIGLALGRVSATGLFKQWNPYAVDGTQYLAGFLMDAIDLSWITGTTTKRLHAAIVKGNVKADQVLIPGETTRGIAGKTYEFLLREQSKGRFLYDDDLDALVNWKVREVPFTSGADSLTVTTAMNRTHFTNRGADEAGTLVLPPPVPGLEFKVTCIAAENITLGAAANDQFLPGTANTHVLAAATHDEGLVTAVRTGASTYQYRVSTVAPVDAS